MSENTQEVGHPAPEPSMEDLVHDITEVVACVRKRDFTSKHFVHHAFDAGVQANAFRKDDSPPEVFSMPPLTSVDACCDYLESKIAEAQQGVQGFNPFLIISAVKTLLALIELFTDDEGEST